MTNQEQPDTRPRCGGEPGNPLGTLPDSVCIGCADCVPAPDTQSGGLGVGVWAGRTAREKVLVAALYEFMSVHTDFNRMLDERMDDESIIATLDGRMNAAAALAEVALS